MKPIGTAAVESALQWIDDLPPALLPDVLAGSGGTARQRAGTATRLRGALLRGALPPAGELEWPEGKRRATALEELARLGLARFCRGNESLTDAVVRSFFASMERARQAWREAYEAELARLEALPREQHAEPAARSLAGAPSPDGGSEGQTADTGAADDAAEAARRRAHREAARQSADRAALDRAVRALDDDWAAHVRAWAELAEVFDDLSDLLGSGFDLTRGILQHHGWEEVVRLARLLKALPQLRELVRSLGRMQLRDHDAPETVVETVLSSVRRLAEELREVRTPLAPIETRGITRSGDLSRMLPSEAALLAKRRLRSLWHARRAENALLAYLADGVVAERVSGKIEVLDESEQERRRPPRERGPIIVCLDTSGSMAGVPETVAKAFVLEALRVAHAERRACHVIAFSGPADIEEHELSLTPDGLGALLAFLLVSFHGGTEVSGPLGRALELLESETWRRADVILVTDGEFPAPSALVHRVDDLKENHEIRVHGLLIGERDSGAVEAICEPVHRFSDWNALHDEEISGASGMSRTRTTP